MGEIKTYKELKVWSKGVAIANTIYELTNGFPEIEKFGLILQMRRCAVSIASNIAEGWGREQTQSFVNYLRIAKGSLFELETQLIIAKDQGFVSESEFQTISNEIEYEGRMLKNLINSIRNNVPKHLKEPKMNYETFKVMDSINEL